MRVPLSWLREYARLPEPVDATEVARRLTAAGLEVESLESVGHDIRGVVIAQVLSIEELTGLKKPIRYCRVAVSEAQLDAPPDEASGVICGATNFAVGDRVALALPGAMLPGGFEIGARKTYGHISEGMICSASELAIGDDHTGIIVLPPDAPLGADFVAYAHLRDEVLEIAVTPDRGYAVSVRGLSRELASAYSVPFTDPASTALPDATLLGGPLDFVGPDVYPARIDDPTACDRFVLREVRGFSPAGPHPAVDAGPAGPVRRAAGVARRGRDQLPDAGARPAAARVRPVQADRRDRGAAGLARGAAGDPGSRGQGPGPAGHPDHRFFRADLHGRHHGRPVHRDRRSLDRPGD